MAYFSRIRAMFESKAGSSSATPSAIPDATTPEQFLELTNACKDRAQRLLAIYVDDSMSCLRVNDKQCKYLAEKLELVVQEAQTFLQGSSISHEEKTNRLNDFKWLHDVACAVENFIRNCRDNAWVVAAFLLLNVPHDVLWISTDLAFLASFFSRNYIKIEVESVYRAEASGMAEKAASDRHLLVRNVKAVLRTEEKTSAEYRLAEFLLNKLETPGAYCTDIESLTEEYRLGKGGYGVVYKSKWLGIDVAVKTFHGPSSPDLKTEVEILGRLSHPNVASMFCYAEDDMECSIVMELMDCDLSDMIRNIMSDKSRKPRNPFNIFEAVDIMLQVGKGIEYLHEMKIVHRDLKAANILVKKIGKWRDGESKSILAKVADFGMSRTKEKSSTYSMQSFNKGTTRWMAPEMIQMRRIEGKEEVSNDTNVIKYPYRSDVYSFGMVCYEILTGKQPYFEVQYANEVKKMILRGDRPELPEHCFTELKDLIKRCWSQDASKRPRFDEICAMLRNFRFHLLLLDTPQRIGPQVAIKLDREARIVVGLDFGTTFSGYAYAHKSDPERIMSFYDWPQPTGMKPVCKTLTAIYYEPGDATTAKVKSWGFCASLDYRKDIRNIQKLRAKSAVSLPEIGTYVAGFNLHLASKDDGESSAAKLPKGFTVTQVTADYIREIGASIMRNLRTQFGDHISMADVQWCVTVPSIWDDQAKKQMQVCMARAGLVRSANSPEGSPHPLSIVLKSEAVSCHCHRNMLDLELKLGDRLLVVDIGGATTDIVVQEWMSETPDDFRVKEVTHSTGGLCGTTYVDKAFMKLLFAKIQFLPEFLLKSSAFIGEIIFKQWEDIQYDRVNIGESFEIQLPNKQVTEWEKFDVEHGNPARSSYDELELTHADIKAIFDPVVERIIYLIDLQISRTADVKVIFAVGEFPGSLYLLPKIKERLLETVEEVIYPAVPQIAACQGAVMLAVNAGIIS